MTEPWLIRPAIGRDISQISTIEAHSFPNPWSVDLLLFHIDQQKGGRMYFPVYVMNDAILGYAIGEHYHPEVHISNVAVNPGNRRFGIGTKLVDSLILWAELRNACDIWLEVRESNISAQVMYQHLGFSTAGNRRAYYKNPREDALLMYLALDARGD